MATALPVGILGSSALVLGGALGSVWSAPPKVTGVLLAFASGSLISALAFELFPDAVEAGGLTRSALGLAGGVATFVVVNTWLDARVGEGAGDPEEARCPRRRPRRWPGPRPSSGRSSRRPPVARPAAAS